MTSQRVHASSKSKASKTPAQPPQVLSSTAEVEIAAQANLGPKSAQAIVAAGITSFAELRRLGSVAAYARVKQHDPRMSLNLLWALEGALSNLPWQTVAREHRTSLLLALECHKDGG